MRIVLDTQIYIRLLQPDTWPLEAELWQIVKQPKFKILTSETQLEEIRRVSRRRIAIRLIGKAKFGALVAWLRAYGEVVKVKKVPHVVTADPDDDFIVAIATEGQARYLVSDDKHLNPLGRVGNTDILKPAQALRRFRRF